LTEQWPKRLSSCFSKRCISLNCNRSWPNSCLWPRYHRKDWVIWFCDWLLFQKADWIRVLLFVEHGYSVHLISNNDCISILLLYLFAIAKCNWSEFSCTRSAVWLVIFSLLLRYLLYKFCCFYDRNRHLLKLDCILNALNCFKISLRAIILIDLRYYWRAT
jgi:hypothetical protein